MREIKFRAWVHSDKKMTHPNHMEFCEDRGIGVPISTGGMAYTKFGECSVMQFTGLHDKNRREIYEGDILRGEDYPFISCGLENYRAVVAWDDELAKFYSYPEVCSDRVRGCAAGCYVFEDGQESAKRFEIIGNIHEHPHLLEGK